MRERACFSAAAKPFRVVGEAKGDGPAIFLVSWRVRTIQMHSCILIVRDRPRFIELGIGHRFGDDGWLRRRFGGRVLLISFQGRGIVRGSGRVQLALLLSCQCFLSKFDDAVRQGYCAEAPREDLILDGVECPFESLERDLAEWRLGAFTKGAKVSLVR